MEINVLFKGDTNTEVFLKQGDWYLAPSDTDTIKYTLLNIRDLCPKVEGVQLRIRNYKYEDPKLLWASINADQIISMLNPGGNNLSNWLSNSLDIVGNDSLHVIETTKDLGVWVDENTMEIVIDAWKSHKMDKEDWKTLYNVAKLGTADNHIVSMADAIEVIRQYNKMSNTIVGAFLTANVKGVMQISNENFDCELKVLIDTDEIEDIDNAFITRKAKDIIWKTLVDNRGKIEKLSINIDTENDELEVFKLTRYEDTKGKLKLSNVVLYDIDIQNASLENCTMYKASFTSCDFKECITLGVRVKIKDCTGYEDGIKGHYNIIKEEDSDDKE